MVHQYPGEVVIWAGGPLTNIALALRLDPEVATLAKELVLMGSGMYANNGGINGIDGRREFNWWFDPEAVRIAMRAPWKKITITPIDISVKTTVNPELKAAIAKADTPVARYLTEYSVESFMWDELSAAAMIDPSIITGQKELYVDIDVDHGPSYGETLFWAPGTELPPYERKATVQFDVDTQEAVRPLHQIDDSTAAGETVAQSSQRLSGSVPPPPRATRTRDQTTDVWRYRKWQFVWINQPSGITRRSLSPPPPPWQRALSRSEALAMGPHPAAVAPSSRVIIDTDPGVDDALALLLAMRSPELKIEAITAVAGNVPLELTLPNALRMVEISGRTDIPVAAGAKAPLLRRLVTAAYAHGENGLGGAVFPDPKIKPVAEPAAELIRQIVRKYPGEVTLIPVGPLTNIATALNPDSELAGMVRGIVMMGGSLSGGNITPAAEFNVYVDPGSRAYRVSIWNSHYHGRARRHAQDLSHRGTCARARSRAKSCQPGGSEDRPQRHQPQPRAGISGRTEHA